MHGATICISEVRDIQYCKPGARVLKNFGAPLATKFTYKMRSGRKECGVGPALYKHNYLKKIKNKKIKNKWNAKFTQWALYIKVYKNGL
jgi:hypothetical protein